MNLLHQNEYSNQDIVQLIRGRREPLVEQEIQMLVSHQQLLNQEDLQNDSSLKDLDVHDNFSNLQIVDMNNLDQEQKQENRIGFGDS